MKIITKIIFLFLYIKAIYTLEEGLKIETTNLGAELTSIKYKGKEYLQ